MKRILFFLLVTLVAASACSKKVPSEKIISGFCQHYDKKGDVYREPLARLAPEKRSGYVLLKLGKDLKAADVWTLDFEEEDLESGEMEGGQVIVAEFKSREKDRHISMISACLEDPDACSAVLDVLDAFKEAKFRPALTLRAVFYEGGKSGVDGLKAVARDFNDASELSTFDIEVSSRDSIPERTFIIEDKLAFAGKIVEVIPPLVKPVGDVEFEIGDFPREGWPTNIPTYRYRLSSADRLTDLKVLTAFTFLLN